MNVFQYLPDLPQVGKIDPKLRAAFHEAGHAILGCLHDCPPKSAKIYFKNSKWLGNTINTAPGRGYKIELQVTCAGFYSEAIYAGEYNYDHALNDIITVRELNTFETDTEIAKIPQYQKEIVDILNETRTWTKVKLIAEALYNCEELKQNKILEICK